jgi:hypothetical protein
MSPFDKLLEKWPSGIVARSEISAFTGGAVCPGTLANADCEGVGPKDRFRIGRKVVYPAAAVVEWLKERSKPIFKGNGR